MNRFALPFIFTVGTAALVTALLLASTMYSRAKERQVSYDYLHEALLAPERLRLFVDWDPARTPLVRPVTPGDEAVIGRAITEAWSAFAAAQNLGQTEFLSDYFSGVALERARKAALSAYETGTRMVVLNTHAEPVFHHLDGSVLQVKATMLTVRFAGGAEALGPYRLTEDTVLTTLMNESSGWRIFSHERLDVAEASPPNLARGVDTGRLAGINYYPAETPWRAFWANFDAGVIATDFAKIRSLGANSIRVFLPRDVFLGKSDPDATAPEMDHLENLRMLLDLAQEYDLAVVPTLFDLRQGYDLAGWADDLRYLQDVTPILRDHAAVAFVDLKNEPDLDFTYHGRAPVEAWLRTMITMHRDLAPDLPLTIGWATQADALTLADELDVLSYHDYAPIDGAEDRLNEVRARAAGKPVMITEIGETAYTALAGFPGSPAKQAARLKARLGALARADGLFIWTLHDFPDPDPQAIGHSTWVRNLQSQFGLFDFNDQPKPAATIVTHFNSTYLEGTQND